VTAEPPTSDEDLLRAWQAGDKEAGDALVRRHFASIYRFFRHKLADGAEDLTQRTFLGCVGARDRMRPELGFRAFLFGIARNQLLLELRTRSRRRELPPDSASIEDVAGPTPVGVVAAHEQQRALLQALRKIPIDHQITLELHYWEGLGVDQIALVLEVAPGTVKSRLARARASLVERLQDIEGERDPARLQATLSDLDAWVRSLRDRVPLPPRP
jgi:RNA polymerase sigma-70 factor (ECF subfamily)